MTNLNKENFFNDMQQKYPKAMEKFCKWIDEYKERVGWNSLFDPTSEMHTFIPKFHDIPLEMQLGIIGAFFAEHNTVVEQTNFEELKHSLFCDFGVMERSLNMQQ